LPAVAARQVPLYRLRRVLAAIRIWCRLLALTKVEQSAGLPANGLIPTPC